MGGNYLQSDSELLQRVPSGMQNYFSVLYDDNEIIMIICSGPGPDKIVVHVLRNTFENLRLNM